MLLTIASQLVVLLAALMQSPTTLRRTGDVARQLTDKDVAAIVAVLPRDSSPWLLDGERTQFVNAEYVQAFLAPTVETQVLHRGMIVSVERRTGAMPWVVQRTDAYAQVAIPGRSFNEIRDDHDINRPFRVIGRFDDDELVSLVQFIRSDPPTRGGVAIQQWPILWIKRNADDSVDVPLWEDAWHGQAITLRQNGQDWIIVSIGGWAA